MLTARQVADYFLSLVDEEAGDSLTNLKLQKLVYYAQGVHLAITGKPLFTEEIQAWEHGPVVPSLYRAFKEHGSAPIRRPDNLRIEDYPAGVREILDEVYSVYGQFSAAKLRSLTHAEPTWRQAYAHAPSSPISHESMAGYFKTTLVNG